MFSRIFISLLFFYYFFSPSFSQLNPNCPECVTSAYQSIKENRKYFPENGDLTLFEYNINIFVNDFKKIRDLFQRIVSGNGSILLIGPTGNQGARGMNGNNGEKGNTGIMGATGMKGFRGIQGPPGSMGATGKPGPQGAPGNGPQGPQGVPGKDGSTGQTGIRGPRGLKGSTGFTGPSGSSLIRKGRSLLENKNLNFLCKSSDLNQKFETLRKNFKNLDEKIDLIFSTSNSLKKKFDSLNLKQIKNQYEELTKNQLNKNYQGDTGKVGATGKTGKKGYNGEQGPLGSPGSQGVPGFPGVPGHPGPSGVPGFTGVSGPGPQGATGIPGRDGQTGFTGPTGIRGVQGATGPPGGTQDSSGSQEGTGNSGFTGFTGFPRETGSTGSSGLCDWSVERNSYVLDVEVTPGGATLEECKRKCFHTRNSCKLGFVFNNSPSPFKCLLRRSGHVIRTENFPYDFYVCKNI